VCGGKLRKVFHPAGIVFKGSGFYATDSRSTSKPTGTDKEKRDTAAGAGSADGGSASGADGGSGGSSDGKSGSGTDSAGSKKETSSS
jgi:predicted nucleic acid-binding Zn ribbon protein